MIQPSSRPVPVIVKTSQLAVGMLVFGPPDGIPVFLMHGFPYDAHACVEAAERIAASGCCVRVPWLRGYGPTRFLSAATPRSGEQAVLGNDLVELVSAVTTERAVVAGYDWGGRAGCIVAALWPEKVRALVTCNGYNIQHIARAMEPGPPEMEASLWYQYYFHNERGRRGLEKNRRELARFIWRLWSPTWAFSDEAFNRSATALENPDFVDVVIHSYRHRYGLVEGDPEVSAIEARLAGQPAIRVPTIAIDGDSNGLVMDYAKPDSRHFPDLLDYRVFQGVGHNVPQESPALFAQAVLDAIAATDGKQDSG